MRNQKERWLFRLVTLLYGGGMYLFAAYFSFMWLNILLAWIPMEFGHQVLAQGNRKVKGMFGIGWLLFFPNIPYLLTDLIHLHSLELYGPHGHFSSDLQSWIYFLLLLLPILIFVLLGLQQARQVVATLTTDTLFDRLPQPWWLVLLSGASALAIYIGRFDRIHSVDLILQPFRTFSALFLEWTPTKIGFIAGFTIAQLLLYAVLDQLTKKEL